MTDPIATLASSDRRTVLSCLDDYRTAVDIEELAVDFAAARTDTPRDAVTATDREDAMVRLHHIHLPKLDQAGFVDFDHESGSVRRLQTESPAFASALSD